jgi:hypothetical protein
MTAPPLDRGKRNRMPIKVYEGFLVNKNYDEVLDALSEESE